MANPRWVVTSDSPATYVDQLNVAAGELPGAAAQVSIAKWRIQTGLSQGVDVVRIDNGRMSFAIVPTRGMGLWEARVGDFRLGWNSPVRGPVHPMFVDLGEPSGLGWLDGFDELLVRCGLESNGAPDVGKEGQLLFPLHGRIGNRPAHHVEISVDSQTGRTSVLGIVEETRFHFLKLRLTSTMSTMPGSTAISIVDRVENLSASPAEFQLLYHANFGAPLLDAGAQVVAPASEVAPRNPRSASGLNHWNHFSAEEPGFAEQVYFLKLAADSQGWTQVLLKNAHGSQGASLKFNTRQLPCFTLWKNTTALQDGYVTGLEPGTNYPNPRTFEGEQGRVAKLAAGQSMELAVEIHAHPDSASVDAAEAAVKAYRGQPPQVHATAPDGWTT